MKRWIFVAAVVVLAALAAGANTFRTAKDFTVKVRPNPTLVGTGENYLSLWCDNNSSTSVFPGGATVDKTGICISTNSSNCPRRDLPANFASGVLYMTANIPDAGAGTDAGFIDVHCLVGGGG